MIALLVLCLMSLDVFESTEVSLQETLKCSAMTSLVAVLAPN